MNTRLFALEPAPGPLRPANTPNPVLARFQGWIQSSRGTGLDAVRGRELFMLVGLMLLLPVVMLYFPYAFYRSEEYTTAPQYQKVLLVVLMPVLFPILYTGVVLVHLLWPMLRRVQARRKALRQAGRAVRELTRSLKGVEWEWNVK